MVRVELRGGSRAAAEADQAFLDGAMASAGFSIWMKGSNGTIYHLPSSEYYIAGRYTRLEVMEKAKRAATAPGRNCAILVTEGVGFLWNALEPVPVAENYER
jgi:hypothetical protein